MTPEQIDILRVLSRGDPNSDPVVTTSPEDKAVLREANLGERVLELEAAALRAYSTLRAYKGRAMDLEAGLGVAESEAVTLRELVGHLKPKVADQRKRMEELSEQLRDRPDQDKLDALRDENRDLIINFDRETDLLGEKAGELTEAKKLLGEALFTVSRHAARNEGLVERLEASRDHAKELDKGKLSDGLPGPSGPWGGSRGTPGSRSWMKR